MILAYFSLYLSINSPKCLIKHSLPCSVKLVLAYNCLMYSCLLFEFALNLHRCRDTSDIYFNSSSYFQLNTERGYIIIMNDDLMIQLEQLLDDNKDILIKLKNI